MKHISDAKSVLCAVLFAASPALAQSPSTNEVSSLKLDLPRAPSRNRFGLSYSMGFNAPVSFKNLGGYSALSVPRLTLDGNLYNYDNGFVLPDSGTANSGQTVYWGYDSASQVSGNTITMQRSSSEAIASSNDHFDNPMSGVEITYNRELIRKKSWRGGLEGAFGYNYMSIHDGSVQSANVTRVNDVFAFPAVPPPQVPTAPYIGRLDQPLQQALDYNPISSTTTEILQGASIAGQRDFSANLFSLRLGPYFEIPLSKSINFTLSGGFALMYVDSEFSYNETVTIPGLKPLPQQASGSATGWLPGGYVAGAFSLALSDAWAFVAGAQFESVGQYTQTLNGKQATLDLSKSIFVTLGLSYSF
jgi:hypothetical protein